MSKWSTAQTDVTLKAGSFLINSHHLHWSLSHRSHICVDSCSNDGILTAKIHITANVMHLYNPESCLIHSWLILDESLALLCFCEAEAICPVYLSVSVFAVTQAWGVHSLGGDAAGHSDSVLARSAEQRREGPAHYSGYELKHCVYSWSLTLLHLSRGHSVSFHRLSSRGSSSPEHTSSAAYARGVNAVRSGAGVFGLLSLQ